MKNIIKITAVIAVTTSLTACGGASSKKGTDLNEVLDRTVIALEFAEAKLEKPADEEASNQQVEVFTSIMHQVMNRAPKLQSQPVGVVLREDAAFIGFNDKNGDNVADAGEKELFSIELDGERNRIIATNLESGQGSYRVSGTGLFAGYMIGRLMGRQRRAGVKPSSFANRNVKASKPRSARRASTRARSSTRSGSSRGGK